MISQRDLNARLNTAEQYLTIDQAKNFIINQASVKSSNLLQGRTAASFTCGGSCSWTCSGGCSRGAGNL